ncbi:MULTISPECIES: SDR family oxidoreductase [Burkholderia]|uniref:SDR family oxidoreductase n=1 Tax=Burkholderia TaxID=32008 RepID=UPI0008413455|nr:MULTISPECIES: SDR family oxidoreductase [unclassified Burkholderia]AOK32228.1 gluconate 5-dehydrogenase [Burkholderia sp. Bp7605]
MNESIKQLFDLTGKTALVTGGSRGLGLQLATALGQAGARVIVSARKEHELRDAQQTLRALGVDADWIAANGAQDDEIERLADEAIARLGHVDILVNNAGATWGAPAEDHPVDAWDKVFDLNVRGLFLLTQRIGKHSMIPRGSGRIVNVASIAGLRGNPPGAMTTIAYNSSKGAVVNFTRALAGEWGKYGINVNAIAPGFFPTKMANGLIDAIGADKLIAGAPLQRLGEDGDLAGALLLFASQAGRHITGQILAVDAGVSAV